MTVSMVFVMSHFYSTKSELHFKRGIYRLNPHILMAIMSIGAAPFFVNVAGCVINAIVNNTLYRYGGDSAVAAMGIFTTFTQLLVMIVIGVCQGMQPIVGYNFGARQFQRLNRAYWISVVCSTVICTLGTALCHLCPEAIARAFTTDDALIHATANSLRITTTMFWMAGFQIVSTNFFQSLGYAGKSIFMSLTRQVIFIIPMLLILPPHFGLDGVWAAFPTADTMATVVTIILVISQFRQLHRLEHPTE